MFVSTPRRGKDSGGKRGNQHVAFSCGRLVEAWQASTREGAKQPRAEHHARSEHNRRGDESLLGSRRRHHRSNLRGLRRKGVHSCSSPGQVVVADNLAAHKGEADRQLIEARGCKLLFLPPYSSPDYNPIEEASSKIKDLLRKSQARTREALIEALGMVISANSSRDALGFFKHCGYRTSPARPS